jgi:hypothetical protein
MRTAIEIDTAGAPLRVFHRRDGFSWTHAPGVACAECGNGASTTRPLDPDTLKRQARAAAGTPQEALRASLSRRTPPRVHGHDQAPSSA